jgi:hypothetical protein
MPRGVDYRVPLADVLDAARLAPRTGAPGKAS